MFENDIVEIDDEPITDDDFEILDIEPKEGDEQESRAAEPEEFGKKVQKRIDKLVYERNVEREQRLELERRLSQIEGRFKEEEQAKQASSQESKLAELKAKKAEYFDIGDHEAAANIDEELLELKLQQRESQRQAPTPQAQPEQAEIPEAQIAWLEQNDWYHNPRKAQQAQKANETYLALVSEGYDPDDEDTYRELDKRIHAVRQAAPPPAAPDRGGITGNSRQVKFTQEDAATMRNWGLDPNDMKARKVWIANKRAN